MSSPDHSKAKIIFMGTPDFAAHCLKALIECNLYNIVAVYCQPPRPKNRGQKLQAGAVQLLAKAYNLPLFWPTNFTNTSDLEIFKSHDADLAVVVAYGLILPLEILQAPVRGCVNLHASLLPRWRGAAPIQRAIASGDTLTGVCLMQMDRGMDTGPIYKSVAINILSTDNSEILSIKLQEVASNLLLENLQPLLNGQLKSVAQSLENITYAGKILKEEANASNIDNLQELDSHIRALHLWPGSYLMINNEPIKIIKAQPISTPDLLTNSLPLKSYIVVMNELFYKLPDGFLKIELLQRAGGKIITAKDFINANKGVDSCLIFQK